MQHKHTPTAVILTGKQGGHNKLNRNNKHRVPAGSLNFLPLVCAELRVNEAGGKELESFTERETPLAVGKHEKRDQRVTRAPEKGYDAGRCWEAAGEVTAPGKKGRRRKMPMHAVLEFQC